MDIRLGIMLAVAFTIAACAPDNVPIPEQEAPPITSLPETPIPINGENDETAREIILVGGYYYFEDENGIRNPDIRVNVGDRVRIVFESREGIHDWVVDEIPGARTQLLQPQQSETIEFTPTQRGEYEYYCSYMDHRQMGMAGRFIVE
jgi:heme/copper-type cytochrome/quinol oxidase subunit 2